MLNNIENYGGDLFAEPDDNRPFLSLWDAGPVPFLFSMWARNGTGATAIAATALAGRGLNDKAKHAATVEVPAELVAEAKSKIAQNGNTDSYIVFELGDDGAKLHYRHSTSCVSASDSVKKGLIKPALLRTFRLPEEAKPAIDSGKLALIVICPPILQDMLARFM